MLIFLIEMALLQFKINCWLILYTYIQVHVKM